VPSGIVAVDFATQVKLTAAKASTIAVGPSFVKPSV
jgi:hypothetical protein